jgi:hypothetical protein
MTGRAERLAMAGATIALAALPLLARLPGPTLGVRALLAALGLGAVLHGLGRATARLAGDRDPPLALVLPWGVAAYLAIAGALIAAALHRPGVVLAVHVIAAALGGPGLVRGWRARTRLAPARIAALGLLAAGAALVVLCAAGRWGEALVDAETDYAGQLRRLADTGALDDGTGFARSAGLGGHVLLAAAAAPTDPRLAPIADAALCVLALAGLAAALRRSRWAALVAPLVLLAVPAAGPALEPRWSLVLLTAGAAATLARALEHGAPRLGLVVVLQLAALATLRHGALVLGLALAPALAPLARGVAVRGTAAALLVLGGVAIPYIVALARAERAAAIEWSLGPTAFASAAIGALAALLIVMLSGPPPRPPAAAAARAALLAVAAAIAGAGVLSPSASATWALAAHLGLAGLVVAAGAALGDLPTPDPAAAARRVIPVVALVAALALARFPAGGRVAAVPARAAAAVADARAALSTATSSPLATRAEYTAAQAAVPTGARIGIRVDRADLVDHATHGVVDLAGCRGCDPLRLARSLGLDAVLTTAPADAGVGSTLQTTALR